MLRKPRGWVFFEPMVFFPLLLLIFPFNLLAQGLESYIDVLENPKLQHAHPRETQKILTQLKAMAPRIYFHPDEKYGPVDPQEWLKKADSNSPGDGNGVEWSGPFEQENWSSEGPLLWQVARGPFADELRFKDPARAWTVVEFWYHLPFNDAGLWFGLGDHQGDWESVALLVEWSIEGGGELRTKVPAVYFSQHDGGTWHCAADLAWREIEGFRPIVYSALGSHASFPVTGKHPRAFAILGRDLTAEGRAFDGWRNLRPLALEPYYGFRGHWGRTGWLKWSRGPRVPHARTKSLPRDQSARANRETLALLKRCSPPVQ